MDEPPRDDLEDRIEALEETLADLRSELRPRRGPLGVPRPPLPRDLLELTDEYAIPAAIAVLEANVRTLELLQELIRSAERDRDPEGARERTATASRETLARLDRALTDLESAVEETDLPRNAEARRLLADARALNADIRDRVARSESATGRAAGERDEGVKIDVEAELDQLRDEVDEGREGEDGEDGDGGADAGG